MRRIALETAHVQASGRGHGLLEETVAEAQAKHKKK